MNFRFCLFVCAVFAALTAHAGGSGPLLSPATIAATPLERLDGIEQTTLALQSKGLPYQYAVPVPVALSPLSSGQWRAEGDREVWRLRVQSPGALNLSFTFARFSLPVGGELRLYDGAGLLQQGPYRAADASQGERLWTAVVPGDSSLLEIAVPDGQRGAAQFLISRINHGFRSLRPLAKSGGCNIDVACPQGDAWDGAIRATARITIGNQRLCSAVLLNNTREDGAPLLLTARHCGIGENEELSDASLRVYWNYETSQCGGAPDGSLRQNQGGSTLLAQGAAADFTLVRLDDLPRPEYNVHYAGWDASGEIPASGSTVHHPSGDEKRISLFDQDARRRVAIVDGKEVQSWEVFWSSGVTEPGSSGSGLWDQDHRVIGQLSGGNSSCTSPDSSDVYGRLDSAWTASASAAGQLRAWLDPDGSGALQLDGRDANDGDFRAGEDRYNALPQDVSNLVLDVLLNDIGSGPLRLLSARAESGTVQISGRNLLYQWAPGATTDTVHYVISDRYGQRTSGEARLQRADHPARAAGGAGALGGWLLLCVGAARRRRR